MLKFRLRTLMGLLLAVLACNAARAEDKKPAPLKTEAPKAEHKTETPTELSDKLANPYHPLAVGCRWTYKREIGKLTAVATLTVTAHEPINGVPTAVLRASAEGETAVSHLGLTRDGLASFTFNGMTAEPPVTVLKLPIRKGDAWTAESKVAGQTLKADYTASEEVVDALGGKFTALKVSSKRKIDGRESVTDTWYVENLGVVRQDFTLGERVIKLTLDKYEPGAGAPAMPKPAPPTLPPPPPPPSKMEPKPEPKPTPKTEPKTEPKQ